MRLLNSTTLELHEFLDENIRDLDYAILTHTWDLDNEVTFQDMEKARKAGSSEVNKPGFEKIKQCCAQARDEGIGWVWADTCCINKFSSAELSEAVNSMFRWYARSKICYAYLVDVAGDVVRKANKSGSRIELEKCFTNSKWFKRGWTLQELIAPLKIQFYSQGWVYIGSRDELETQITAVTGIEQAALHGSVDDLKKFSVAQRMCWASDRITSRPEDTAYCLLGIFNVNMPLLYGEGAKKAFFRLQEEILKSSDDHSIFAWTMESSEVAQYPLQGLLASSPTFFQSCGNVRSFRRWDGSDRLSLTNRGIQIQLPMKRYLDHQEVWIAYLNCYRQKGEEQAILAVLLKTLFPGGDEFERHSRDLKEITLIPFAKDTMLEKRMVYIRNVIIRPDPSLIRKVAEPFSFVIKALPSTYQLSEQCFGGSREKFGQELPAFSPPKRTDGFWVQPGAWINWRVVCKLEAIKPKDDRHSNLFLILGNDDERDRAWCAIELDRGQSYEEVWKTVRSGEEQIRKKKISDTIIAYVALGAAGFPSAARDRRVFGVRAIEVRVAVETSKWKQEGKRTWRIHDPEPQNVSSHSLESHGKQTSGRKWFKKKTPKTVRDESSPNNESKEAFEFNTKLG